MIYLIFNRPDATARSFEAIAAARPSALFVVADGPRPDHEGEAERCRAARAVVEQVDWDCTLTRDYSDVNLGEVARIPAAISRVLSQTGEAIIVEDDCVPAPSFFRFCDELLKYYRSDERIMSVTGFSPLGNRQSRYSYSFARNPVANGAWATWERAWRCYDYDLTAWPALRGTRWLEDVVPVREASTLWRAILDGEVSPGDYGLRWVFNCWTQNGMGIVPSANLVTNIGFGPDATRMRGVGQEFFDVATEEATFPLRHPQVMIPDRDSDEHVWRFMYSISPFARHPTRWRHRVLGVLPPAVRRELLRARAALRRASRDPIEQRDDS